MTDNEILIERDEEFIENGNARTANAIDVLRAYPTLKGNAKIAQMRVDIIEAALAVLTPEERLIVEGWFFTTEKGKAERLCKKLFLERSTLFRKRNIAIQKFAIAYFGYDSKEIKRFENERM